MSKSSAAYPMTTESNPGPICISGATFTYITSIWHDDDNDGVIDPGELG